MHTDIYPNINTKASPSFLCSSFPPPLDLTPVSATITARHGDFETKMEKFFMLNKMEKGDAADRYREACRGHQEALLLY